MRAVPQAIHHQPHHTAGVVWIAVSGGHAKTGDRSQQVISFDVGPHVARGSGRVEQRLAGRGGVGLRNRRAGCRTPNLPSGGRRRGLAWPRQSPRNDTATASALRPERACRPTSGRRRRTRPPRGGRRPRSGPHGWGSVGRRCRRRPRPSPRSLRTGASTPEAVNTAIAAVRSDSILRRASARTWGRVLLGRRRAVGSTL